MRYEYRDVNTVVSRYDIGPNAGKIPRMLGASTLWEMIQERRVALPQPLKDAELAREIGITSDQLRNIKRSKSKRPTFEVLSPVARWLGWELELLAEHLRVNRADMVPNDSESPVGYDRPTTVTSRTTEDVGRTMHASLAALVRDMLRHWKFEAISLELAAAHQERQPRARRQSSPHQRRRATK